VVTMKQALLISFIVLQVVDGATTAVILARGGRELNPLVRFFIEKIGERTALAAVKTLAIVLFCVIYDPSPWWVLAALCALYVVICLRNVWVLWRQRGEPR